MRWTSINTKPLMDVKHSKYTDNVDFVIQLLWANHCCLCSFNSCTKLPPTFLCMCSLQSLLSLPCGSVCASPFCGIICPLPNVWVGLFRDSSTPSQMLWVLTFQFWLMVWAWWFSDYHFCSVLCRCCCWWLSLGLWGILVILVCGVPLDDVSSGN